MRLLSCLKLYHVAAAQGNIDARVNIGCMYTFGEGVVKDFFLAAKQYMVAVRKGNAHEQTNLGVCFANEEGMEKEEERTLGFLNKQQIKDTQELYTTWALSMNAEMISLQRWSFTSGL